MAKIYQKILHFIKYHNLVSILFTLVFVGFSLSLAGSPEMREAIYSKREKEVGVDNTLLLATNIETWDFQPQILDIEEDEENYYVSYKFKTLGVKENVWQEIWRENLLSFQKVVLGNRDLADYISEEIGEVILHEYQLLKDSQKIAQKEGKSQRVKVVEYSGLIGKVLNLEPKIEPIEPKVSEINTESLSQRETLPGSSQELQFDEETIRQIVEKILAEKGYLSTPTQTCTPNWSCSDWTPLPEEVCLGENFTQTRTCTDLNNCGIDEGKPAETQQATGTKDCSQNASSSQENPL